MSNSKFTTFIFFRFFKLVSLSVWGIIFISNKLFFTRDIVSETPLIETEAFSNKNLANFLSLILNLTIQDLSIIFIDWTKAVVSTCPWIKLPEIFWP